MTTRHARFATPASPESVAFARDRVLTQVNAWGLTLEKGAREAIKLVASELITNAVVHAEGLITLGLYLGKDRLLLVVHDGSRALPTPPASCDPAESESGRGLLLVNTFADRWGSDPTPGGKKVWAEFDVPRSCRPPSQMSSLAYRGSWPQRPAPARLSHHTLVCPPSADEPSPEGDRRDRDVAPEV
ncbi:ATP-binding protein [Streptomyces noboritoensis]|uniref:ATP-binding protein n=1 Tax=Streptomyces noboritoensis TaxID=67337 RepID=A0ABV6T903_9ACTN